MDSLNIETVDPFSPHIARLTSPRTLQAIQQLGLEGKDLVYIPKSEFLRQGLGKDLAEQRFSHHEARRAKYIAEVKAVRLEIARNTGESPKRKEAETRGKAASPVREMEERERKLLSKLQKHKEKQLDLALLSEAKEVHVQQKCTVCVGQMHSGVLHCHRVAVEGYRGTVEVGKAWEELEEVDFGACHQAPELAV